MCIVDIEILQSCEKGVKQLKISYSVVSRRSALYGHNPASRYVDYSSPYRILELSLAYFLHFYQVSLVKGNSWPQK